MLIFGGSENQYAVTTLIERTGDFDILVGYQAHGGGSILCKRYTGPVPEGGHDTIQCDRPVSGRYLSIVRIGGYQLRYLGLCEVMVHGYKQIGRKKSPLFSLRLFFRCTIL